MASFRYHGSLEDSAEILSILCAQGFGVVVEPAPSETPDAKVFAVVDDELRAILRRAPGFYLTGPFARFPIQFRRIAAGPAAGKFVIDLLTQGPLMQCLASRINVVDGRPTLLAGDVSYQDAYLNPETRAWEKATPALKAAYKTAVATIKRRMVKLPADARVFLTPAALAALERGDVRLGPLPL